MKLSTNISTSFTKIKYITKYIGNEIFKTEELVINYKDPDTGKIYDQELIAFNHVTPNSLLDKRYLKGELRSCKINAGSYIYIKLLVEVNVTRVDLLDENHELIAYLYNESKDDHNTDDYSKNIFEHYVINESNFVRVIILSNDNSKTPGLLLHTDNSESNEITHFEHQVLSYYDKSDYSYMNKELMDEILKIVNVEVNSGFLITEDFSKLFLGCYFNVNGTE